MGVETTTPRPSSRKPFRADGTLVATDAEHKEGVDIAYDGTWGYHPLLVSLANTGEPQADRQSTRQPPFARRCGGRLGPSRRDLLPGWLYKVLLRGDTDFSQTEHRTAGTRMWPNPLHLRLRCPTQSDQPGRAFAGKQPGSRLSVANHLASARNRVSGSPTSRTSGCGRGPSRRSVPVVKRWRSSTIARRSRREEYRMVVVRKNISREKGEQYLLSR